MTDSATKKEMLKRVTAGKNVTLDAIRNASLYIAFVVTFFALDTLSRALDRRGLVRG